MTAVLDDFNPKSKSWCKSYTIEGSMMEALMSNHGFSQFIHESTHIWDKVFKNGPSETCERQPLKILKLYGLLKQSISLQIF